MEDTSEDASASEQAQEQILYTAEEAAALVQLTPYWLKYRARQGLIPHRRVGRLFRFAREDLEAIKDMSAQPVKTPRESA
ncbi:helix-turn-helix domain-containing protein [Nonomuraea phyllanthi]|uniref:Helix-turn-helix domain-containing protein n=1 Tax=Nonomuraea phyllanthi TaxID=2219224 RepID=A0A5C4V637_9ACTN|nr:helix-turn-helix domain-containing protein [Nonomuraea phyllanthi]KAB8186959.1 helix-turn-helix domain-containing protein [Nonomuraea phyllanthi]